MDDYRKYDNGSYTIEEYEENESYLFTVFDDSDTPLKMYRTDETQMAQELWYLLCEILDYRPESMARLRLKNEIDEDGLELVEIIDE